MTAEPRVPTQRPGPARIGIGGPVGSGTTALIESLIPVFAARGSERAVVTNEVGLGIVPDNRLARDFRDAAGWLNQTVAQAADEVWLCVAGYPVKVKPNDHPF